MQNNSEQREPSDRNNFAALRATLFETMNEVKAGKMDLDRARTVNAIGKTLVESAMVEVEFIKATGVDGTGFIGVDGEDSPEEHLRLASSKNPAAHNPFPTSARHRLKG